MVKKIWVRATGNPVKRPYPETRTKPPIGNNPVEVVDSVHYRRLIAIDGSLELCKPPQKVEKKKEKK